MAVIQKLMKFPTATAATLKEKVTEITVIFFQVMNQTFYQNKTTAFLFS